jgi:hypothetical protein
MSYSFEILGVLPVLHFFQHQQKTIHPTEGLRAEYVGGYRCTLDHFLHLLDDIPARRNWDLEFLAQTVVQYWMDRAPVISYWKDRLDDAGDDCLLVARVADLSTLRAELETLLE